MAGIGNQMWTVPVVPENRLQIIPFPVTACDRLPKVTQLPPNQLNTLRRENLMIISVINHSKLNDSDVLTVIRAINRQIAEDFSPYWSMTATLRLEGRSERKPNPKNPADMRGDAIIYIWDEVDVDGALGYHETNHRGIPFGFVFRELSERLKEPWTVTLSHEALELIGDPEVNLLVAGPHPTNPRKEVFHWFEMCDAVQNESYRIDEVEVSNFVLPLYFTLNDEPGARNDFLSKPGAGTLKSFGVNPGGYVGFYNPENQKHETYSVDERADERRQVKALARTARRAIRYQAPHVFEATATAPLTRGLRFEGFSISSPDAKAAQAAVNRVLGRGWKVQPFSARGTDFLVSHVGMGLTTSEAWEGVYGLRKAQGIQRAEPLFELEFVEPEDVAAGPGGRRMSGLFGGHKPESAAKDWSIRLIKAREAWVESRGKGVRIAHPDTGYTEHPEIWNSTNPQILAELGEDLVNKDKDPKDDLDSGFLKFPGHGTSTASVIMSSDAPPAGSNVNEITGVAPDASLIPFRVSRSVIHLSMSNLIAAIYKAVDVKAHVISMSLGGLWDGALHEAVKEAVRNDIIVLAAAGNYTGFVTWPAAYDEVIAVAACNVNEEEWSGSSRGSAVDISAPGESVWVARPQRDANKPYIVDRSNGTSFAVAHVAGVAALWLSKHGRDALIAKYGSGNLVGVFKEILLTKGFDQPSEWDTGNFGVGIVNARKVLAAALPARAPVHGVKTGRTRAVSIEERRSLPTFAHLLEHVETNTVERILSDTLNVTVEELRPHLEDFGDEFAFHLATNATVRDAFVGPAAKAAAVRGVAAPENQESTALLSALASASGSPSLVSRLAAGYELRAQRARTARA
jgi:hypothetical protein